MEKFNLTSFSVCGKCVVDDCERLADNFYVRLIVSFFVPTNIKIQVITHFYTT